LFFSETFFISLFLIITTNAFGVQDVYLVEGDDALKFIRTVKNLPSTSQEKIDRVLKDKRVKKIDSKTAQEKLGFEWMDDDFDVDLPPLLACYISEKEKFGLFAFSHIPEDSPILEYKGEITYYKTNQHLAPSPHAIHIDLTQRSGFSDIRKKQRYIVIDATRKGNAGRLVKHMFYQEELLECIFHNYSMESIAKINAKFEFHKYPKLGSRQVLKSTGDIEIFDPLLCYFDQFYGYEDSAWPYDPVLFDKDGFVIPPEKYSLPKKLRIKLIPQQVVTVEQPLDGEMFISGCFSPFLVDKDRGKAYIRVVVTDAKIGALPRITLYSVNTEDIKRILTSFNSRSKFTLPCATPTTEEVQKFYDALQSENTEGKANFIAELKAINGNSQNPAPASSSASSSSTNPNAASGSDKSSTADTEPAPSSAQPSGSCPTSSPEGGTQSCGVSDTGSFALNGKEPVVSSVSPALEGFSQNDVNNKDTDNIGQELLNLFLSTAYSDAHSTDISSQEQYDVIETKIKNSTKMGLEEKEHWLEYLYMIESLSSSSDKFYHDNSRELFNQDEHGVAIEDNLYQEKYKKLFPGFFTPSSFFIPEPAAPKFIKGTSY